MVDQRRLRTPILKPQSSLGDLAGCRTTVYLCPELTTFMYHEPCVSNTHGSAPRASQRAPEIFDEVAWKDQSRNLWFA